MWPLSFYALRLFFNLCERPKYAILMISFVLFNIYNLTFVSFTVHKHDKRLLLNHL